MKAKLIFYDHEGLVDEVYDITCTRAVDSPPGMDDVPDDDENERENTWPNKIITGMDEW